MQFYLAIFALAVSSVLAQLPTPCTTPPQWEARYLSFDRDRLAQIRARISYDAIYQRTRVIEEDILGKDDYVFDTLYLQNQKIEYRFNLKTRNCTKQAVTRPWRNIAIPSNATSYGESYVGSAAVASANLLVTLWGDKFVDDEGNEHDYMGAWTYEACLPVNGVFYTKSDNTIIYQDFFDITPGISDPNKFIPRKECL